MGDIAVGEEHWLTYTIHFQNTGTAAAQNIELRDTLDADLDLATFQVLAQSHGMQTFVTGNAVRFSFPNINLPDSTTDEPNSHGYVQYRINTLPNLSLGTAVENTASIYFDFNAPVVTNTTVNNVELLSGVKVTGAGDGVQIQVWPNPASDMVNIQMNKELVGEELVLTNIYGEELKRERLLTHTSHLSTNHLPSGLYFLRIANTVQRLVIQ